jgi:hypothetical protein
MWYGEYEIPVGEGEDKIMLHGNILRAEDQNRQVNIPMHSDDEHILNPDTFVFGYATCPREIKIVTKANGLQMDLELGRGDAYVMLDSAQKFTKHSPSYWSSRNGFYLEKDMKHDPRVHLSITIREKKGGGSSLEHQPITSGMIKYLENSSKAVKGEGKTKEVGKREQDAYTAPTTVGGSGSSSSHHPSSTFSYYSSAEPSYYSSTRKSSDTQKNRYGPYKGGETYQYPQ